MKLNNYMAFVCLLNIAAATLGTLILIGIGFRWSTFILTVANLGSSCGSSGPATGTNEVKPAFAVFIQLSSPKEWGQRKGDSIHGTYPPSPESNGH